MDIEVDKDLRRQDWKDGAVGAKFQRIDSDNDWVECCVVSFNNAQ
jgi:hypothetical protein